MREVKKVMINKDLVREHTLIFAYICHFMDLGDDKDIFYLIDIGWELEEEIEQRKISEQQINKYIQIIQWNADEKIMINKYLFSHLLDIAES